MRKIIIANLIAAFSILNAGEFDAQANKDLKALKEYMEKKFATRKGAESYFPYTPKEELDKNFKWGIKGDDFCLGSYAYNKNGKEQYDEVNEMPPYEDNIDAGKELYAKKFKNGKSFKDCFPNPAIKGEYPKFVQGKGVVTLADAINACLKENGEKPWNMAKGKMADLEAFFAHASKEKGKRYHIVINSKEAQEAYEHGKKIYYSQRGYLKLSCANCHVQGAGKRVRNEYLSPLYGQVTHFPVYRLAWEELGTLQRRIKGCEKNQGETTHKLDSKWMRDLIYFLTYMSNGLPVDGPDIRK